jgi:hypothetical protein
MKQYIFHQKKTAILTILIVMILILNIVAINSIAQSSDNINKIDFSINFSKPIIEDKQEFISIKLNEVTSYSLTPGNPKLPIVSKTIEFPIGTKIESIKCNPLNKQIIKVSSLIEPTPLLYSINGDKYLGTTEFNKEIYQNDEVFPSSIYNYHVGAGLNKNNEHVMFLSIQLSPIQYYPKQGFIEYTNNVDISINYKLPDTPVFDNSYSSDYELVIITPDEYASSLTPLISHKQNHGLTVLLKKTSEIYNEFQGRDDAEKIKYFVKYAIENYNTIYILLIGDIKQLPMRSADAYPWEGYHGNGLLTDLYYADVYDETGEFNSWDLNQNSIYGETLTDNFPPQSEDNIDGVDLYADVHYGRIPCSTNAELTTVLNKIITYETVTYDQTWFQKIILAGGDTFPLSKGSAPFIYEGEITNVKVAQQLPEFEKIFLWSSKRNLHVSSFNRWITKGAGFVSYAGHGFEHGWGTYRPNAVLNGNLILYYTPFIKALRNQHKLPIIFFDACLTVKLDFNITDLIEYYGLKARIVNLFLGRYTEDDFLPPFAWSFLKKVIGGAIATIGATRPAYTWVDEDGVYAGAGYLDVHFFKAYEEGVTVGEMMTSSQNDYINNVGEDFFTIEEYMILGDPSLKVGGYP